MSAMVCNITGCGSRAQVGEAYCPACLAKLRSEQEPEIVRDELGLLMWAPTPEPEVPETERPEAAPIVGRSADPGADAGQALHCFACGLDWDESRVVIKGRAGMTQFRPCTCGGTLQWKEKRPNVGRICTDGWDGSFCATCGPNWPLYLSSPCGKCGGTIRKEEEKRPNVGHPSPEDYSLCFDCDNSAARGEIRCADCLRDRVGRPEVANCWICNAPAQPGEGQCSECLANQGRCLGPSVGQDETCAAQIRRPVRGMPKLGTDALYGNWSYMGQSGTDMCAPPESSC